MIRQAISCDVCGAEKRQTNHWFVAYAHAGELRVSGWSAGGRTRAGVKHLCGQTCLYKLLDEFIAGAMANRAQGAPEEPGATDASLTSSAAYAVPSAPVAASMAPVRPVQVVPAALISLPAAEEAPNYAYRRRRAEAWERERERCAAVSIHRKKS